MQSAPRTTGTLLASQTPKKNQIITRDEVTAAFQEMWNSDDKDFARLHERWQRLAQQFAQQTRG
jgi:hypothetical protein